MLSEADARIEIDESLKNKGWILSGKNKNVFTEITNKAGRADYILRPANREHPLIVIEAKKKGKDLNEAIHQSTKYAQTLKAPIAYASDGSNIKTIHLSNNKPLILNGEEVDYILSESLALQYLHTNEYNTIETKVIQSRKELINIFSSANRELRKEGLQAGIERFSEFCNILFLKIFSEEVEIAEQSGSGLHNNIPKEFRWSYFRNKDGNELLSYVNDTVLKYFKKEYGDDIFASFRLQNPVVLKKIIDKLDPLSLANTNSDIKGDAFEYFLKAYLANQNKDLGEYFTPRHIVKTLVKLVNPRFGETVYDPFCGTGGMLIESFKHIYNKMPMSERNLNILKTNTIYGSEITQNAKITKMNMILTGDGHNNILKQCSLNNPSIVKHDVVITNMPFSLGKFDEYSGKYDLGSSNGNSLCIEHCFNAINEKSSNPRIGIIVPNGILFDKKYTKLREYIYKNSYVQDIISLPFESFKPYAEVETSILFLTKVKQQKTKQKAIWHFTVKNDGYTANTKKAKKDHDSDLDIFLSFNGIENESKLLEIGFNKLNMESIENNYYISTPNAYKSFDFKGKYKFEKLDKFLIEVSYRNDISAPVWSVTNDKGFVLPNELFNEQVASDNTDKYKLIKQNTFAYNPSRINVGSLALNETSIIGCVSPMYVCFKIKNEHLLNPKYLLKVLKSKFFLNIVKESCSGSVRKTLKFEKLLDLQIPVPSIEEQLKIIGKVRLSEESILKCKNEIKNIEIEIEETLNDLWSN